MKNNLLLSILLLLNCAILTAQYEYAPSEAHPFGLPNPDAPAEIKDYEPMIGICDCKSVRLGKTGAWSDSMSMSWEFRYIMNGMAVQDFTLKMDGTHAGSIRQFNADSSQWYVHNYTLANTSSSLPIWQGGKEGNDIILYRSQKAPNGLEGYYKITFKDITPHGFNWIGEWVNLDESIVFPTWTVNCIKRE